MEKVIPGEIFIEILEADGSVRERLALRDAGLRIGGELDNDLVLDDESVSGYHAEIEWTDTDGFRLADCHSTNGLFDLQTKELVRSMKIVDGASVRIGNTALRFRTLRSRPKTVPIDHSRIVNAKSITRAWLMSWTAVIMLMTAIIWFETLPKDRNDKMLFIALGTTGFLLFWSSFWAVLSRLFNGQTRFIEHGRIIGLATVGMISSSVVLPALSYGLGIWSWTTFLQSPIELSILSWLMYQHVILCRRNSFRRKSTLKIAVGFALSLLVTVQLDYYFDQKKFDHWSAVKLKTYPSFVRLAGEESLNNFLSKTNKLKEKVDALAREEQ